MGRPDTGRRHPHDHSHTPAARPTTPVNVVTYRYQDRMVYVTPAATYEEAVRYAQTVFPDELAHVDKSRIMFSVSVTSPDGSRSVQIGPMAWAAVTASLAQYEIIDVVVNPEVIIQDMDADGLPPYHRHLDVPNEEKREYRSRSASPSRAKSRTPSPNSSSSFGRTGKRQSWLEKLERHLPGSS
ncbi:uncharacterized protein FIBRA_02186 [Fibroporia radiculosa]|uniref:Uncharacterized protein n=1 Tax=Fibroporia radiculosa TaxID=599839 RepID=J4G1E4_9APHY|nr:uncharacterized protein FIBRA_02186 [Fibroporia radiculosa]CCM00158.1 predicted protein [Fibroporia radiculosa]